MHSCPSLKITGACQVGAGTWGHWGQPSEFWAVTRSGRRGPLTGPGHHRAADSHVVGLGLGRALLFGCRALSCVSAPVHTLLHCSLIHIQPFFRPGRFCKPTQSQWAIPLLCCQSKVGQGVEGGQGYLSSCENHGVTG
jgi:hypothetical protein